MGGHLVLTKSDQHNSSMQTIALGGIMQIALPIAKRYSKRQLQNTYSEVVRESDKRPSLILDKYWSKLFYPPS